MIRILRPVGAPDLISARVFDDSFASSLSPELSIKQVDLAEWLDSIFGQQELQPDDRTVREAFKAVTRDFDFLCPNYRGIPVLPLLLYVRNHSRSPIRLLLIAHAPGAYALEWALLLPLLRTGDLIIAPTLSAYHVVNFLCPELAPYTRIVPHPVHPLPDIRSNRRLHIVSLTRMHPSKLLHRQVEAMALLTGRGVRRISMRIAGPVSESSRGDMSPYARSLAAKIERLHLKDAVELVGQIDGEQHKAKFLYEARLLVNLSVTIEESFGKAIVEALGCGVPILATRWNGLPETVGSAGACVPVTATALGVDVSAEQIADAIQRLIEAPSMDETCQREAARFHPQRVRRLYRYELEAAMEDANTLGNRHDGRPAFGQPGAPASGLLSATAPLNLFSWNELFKFHLQDAARLRAALASVPHLDPCEADELRSLLILGTRAPMERLMAGLKIGTLGHPVGQARDPGIDDTDFFSKVGTAAMSRATRSSRMVCLELMAVTGRSEQLQLGLQTMRADGVRSWGMRHLEIEALRQQGEYQRAFQMIIELDEPALWGELAADRLRQLAVVCREWNLPGFALPWLREWLERFPDSPDSAMVWLDRCLNALCVSPSLLTEARLAFDSARKLLGTSVDLSEIESRIHQAERDGEGAPKAKDDSENGATVEHTRTR